MFSKPSLMTRVAIGKTIGLIVGLFGFFLLPYFSPESDPLLRWGVLFWYITVGAVIGVYGVFIWHPVLHLPMPWWFRAPLIGGWMNFVLTFFAYDAFQSMIISIFGEDFIFGSPFWFVLEGAIVGLIMGFFATRFGGEGRETVDVPTT
ncbi:MAG: hypothetical protein COB93_05195 [Sneathiella sp.]|nr:MAG: hypothetical protein COB93_05195 [Sneathiella sp.]